MVAKIAFGEGEACYLWVGARGATGYGHIYWDGKVRDAHRVVYSIMVGGVEGFEVDHVCHNKATCEGKCIHRACVRLGHLRLATHRENIRSGHTRPGANLRKTHCPRGHPYSPENTKVEVYNGSRKCRICRRERDRRRWPARSLKRLAGH